MPAAAPPPARLPARRNLKTEVQGLGCSEQKDRSPTILNLKYESARVRASEDAAYLRGRSRAEGQIARSNLFMSKPCKFDNFFRRRAIQLVAVLEAVRERHGTNA